MPTATKKIILFANGELPAPEKISAQIKSDDVLIAVDGGLGHLTRLGLKPHLIIGDLDSASEDEVRRFKNQGVEVRKYPVEKDETDLELALAAALKMKPETIWVVAALGNRLDQTLGNIFLLTRPELVRENIRLVDGAQEVFLIHQSASLSGESGQRVSLLPLNRPAEGVITEGLEYPLNDETLYPDRTRGISNRMTGSKASISIKSGLLLCIHETLNQTKGVVN